MRGKAKDALAACDAAVAEAQSAVADKLEALRRVTMLRSKCAKLDKVRRGTMPSPPSPLTAPHAHYTGSSESQGGAAARDSATRDAGEG